MTGGENGRNNYSSDAALWGRLFTVIILLMTPWRMHCDPPVERKNQQTHSPFLTFVVVCCAIFGFPVLIVWLFNFLQNKVINRWFILTGIYQPTACKFISGIFGALSEWNVLLIGKSCTAPSVLQQTHINAMKVNTPVGSSPGGNEAITVFARRGQGGACGC